MKAYSLIQIRNGRHLRHVRKKVVFLRPVNHHGYTSAISEAQAAVLVEAGEHGRQDHVMVQMNVADKTR